PPRGSDRYRGIGDVMWPRDPVRGSADRRAPARGAPNGLRNGQRGSIILRRSIEPIGPPMEARLNVRQTSLFLALVAVSGTAAAQGPQAKGGALSLDELKALATVEVGMGKIRDSVDLQLALAKNKKDEVQRALRDRMANDVATLLKKSNMTDAEYRKKTFL